MNNNTTTTTAAVAYYRVSTQRQGASGLGLESQQEAVKRFARQQGLTITDSFVEVESGTRKGKRPQIAAALETAKRSGAVLLIAKLDRLARNVAFVSALMESGVQFKAVDMPMADNLTVHIIAAMAEHEAKLISERTKSALAAAKARGVTLGKPENLTSEAQQRGAAANKRHAQDALKAPAAYAQDLHEAGLSLRKIAAKLNSAGMTTQRGSAFSAVQVKRMLERSADQTLAAAA